MPTLSKILAFGSAIFFQLSSALPYDYSAFPVEYHNLTIRAPKPIPSKRGLAYNDPNKVRPFSSQPAISWAYNWNSKTDKLPDNIEFVPMLWSAKPGSTSHWIEDANRAIAAGSHHLLAFNEPDHKDQADISPEEAAAQYRKYMSIPFGGRPGIRLGSPSITDSGVNGMGFAWMRRFLAACSDCQIDFTVIHWYSTATNIGYFKRHIEQAHAVGGGRPIWITEFGGFGSDAEIAKFLETVLPWLDSQDYVERYSYFMARDGILNQGADLSNTGRIYATFH